MKLHFHAKGQNKPVCGTHGSITHKSWKVTCGRCQKSWKFKVVAKEQRKRFEQKMGRKTETPKQAVERLIAEANAYPYFAA